MGYKDKEKRKEYLEANKEKIRLQKKLNYEANREKILQRQNEYNKSNKEKIREYQRNKYNNDILYRLKKNMRNQIGNSIRNGGFKKLTHTEQILGCTYEEFKLYLESLFKPWMNWENRGLYNGEENYGWDIDHIIPLSTATCEADIIRLNHYSNLQPLCSHINRDIKRQ